MFLTLKTTMLPGCGITEEKFKNTNLQFCGLIMGDYSKCGINTMFNTGSVVGVSANIFEVVFLEILFHLLVGEVNQDFRYINYIRCLKYAKKYLLEGRTFDKIQKDILSHVYDMTKRYRNE